MTFFVFLEVRVLRRVSLWHQRCQTRISLSADYVLRRWKIFPSGTIPINLNRLLRAGGRMP